MGRPKLYHTDEGRREARRRVNAKYHRTEKGQAAMARQNASPLASARYARYRETQGYRDAQERHRQKQIATGWPAQTAQRIRLQAERPEVIAARAAVAEAVRSGLLVRPPACSTCGSVKAIHGHHHKGYEGPAALDVVWLCAKCHKAAHR